MNYLVQVWYIQDEWCVEVTTRSYSRAKAAYNELGEVNNHPRRIVDTNTLEVLLTDKREGKK